MTNDNAQPDENRDASYLAKIINEANLRKAFHSALQNTMKRTPDVILVGELRTL